MKLNADILYRSLSEYFEVKCSGKMDFSLNLEPPVFFREGIRYREGMVCVGRTGEFTEPGSNVQGCLLICVGGRLPSAWHAKSCCMFSIEAESDLFYVFNILQETFTKYEKWQEELRRILVESADVGEMLKITAPLLNNSITLCNKHLEIVAQASPDGEKPSMIGRTPSAERVRGFADTHARNIAMREPFIYHSGENDMYCINIYKQDGYQGLLLLSDLYSPHTPGQLALFRFFFQYVSAAVEKGAERGKGSLVTLKVVFRDLLNCVSVSDARLTRAFRNANREEEQWVCLAGRPSGDMVNLPVEYLCMQAEALLPGSIALYMEPYVAMLLPEKHLNLLKNRAKEGEESDFSRIFCHAGVSPRFDDIRKARFHYRQAVAALETAESIGPIENLSFFDDYALYYALGNSTGEFAMEYMIPEGLQKLRCEDGKGGESDGWRTLKVYLDNEMNGMQTARDLYIHRTTLQNRLRRIEQLVDLGTPQKRLYIRYCMYLYEMYDEMKN
jgi:hypothetical protein